MAEPPQAELPPEDAVVTQHEPAPHGKPCRACGCPVEPDDHFCPACGAPRAGKPQAAPAGSSAAVAQKFFRCSNCGSEMSADPDQRSYMCPFCDSTFVVEFSPEWTNRQPPEFVIGFAVTRQQALEKFHAWLRSNSWFHPGDLSSASIADKQKGVYLPFWSFSMLAESSWRATIGEYWYRTETYTTRDAKGRPVLRTRRVQHTEWWPLSGHHHRYYNGYLVSASKGLPQHVAEAIMPFNLPALKRYAPYFLAGWLCEEYSISRDAALELCRREFQRREHANVAGFLPGDTHRDLQVDTDFRHINSDLCLLPVHILSYRYRDKLYRFLVNGQTGKGAGDKPLSWSRIGVAITIGLLLAAFVAALFVVGLRK